VIDELLRDLELLGLRRGLELHRAWVRLEARSRSSPAASCSRRLSIVIGSFVMGIAVTLFGAVGDVWPILAANALWGFGYTFTSGAFDAWLADEVGQRSAWSETPSRSGPRSSQVRSA
jgi:hypothetical protein